MFLPPYRSNYSCALYYDDVMKYLFLLCLSISSNISMAIRVQGSLKLDSEESTNYKILTRFGFQKTDQLNLEETRGYIFGNVTGGALKKTTADGDRRQTAAATLILVNFAHFRRIYDILREIRGGRQNFDQSSCQKVMAVVGTLAFHPRCNLNGAQDFYRTIPCPTGGLCHEEDQPKNVFNESQLTYRVQDKGQARFWYLVAFGCILDDNCTWRQSLYTTLDNASLYDIDYDLYLVNGHPQNRTWWKNFLVIFDRYQISIDQHHLAEIRFFSLLFTCLLLTLQIRAQFCHYPTKRGQFLLLILLCVSCQHFLSLCHFLHLAWNGRPLTVARILADDLLDHVTEYLLALLLILVAKGWKIRTLVVKRRFKTFTLISALFAGHILFYAWAQISQEYWLDTCIFDVWQGWAILLVRLLTTCWFFLELRLSVKLENDESKRLFLLHFGSGFLVWFVYLPILGAFSSNIPMMSRLKIIDGLHHLSNFVVLSVLTHLFYPKSSNRRFFLSLDKKNANHHNSVGLFSLSSQESEFILDDDEEESMRETLKEDNNGDVMNFRHENFDQMNNNNDAHNKTLPGGFHLLTTQKDDGNVVDMEDLDQIDSVIDCSKN